MGYRLLSMSNNPAEVETARQRLAAKDSRPMTQFLITAPDGRKFRVTGETQEGAVAALQQHLASQPTRSTDTAPIGDGAPGKGNMEGPWTKYAAKGQYESNSVVLNINGQRVKVDESFLRLSPEQQSTTVDEIASSLRQAMPGSSPSTGGAIEVDLPDGTIAEFPAGTSRDTMQNALRNHYGTNSAGETRDLGQVERAFMKAHQAGDTEAATILAREVKRLRAEGGISAETQPQRSLSDVPGEALSNLGSSAAKFAGDAWQSVSHPVATAQNIDAVARGGVMHIPGVKAVNDFAVNNLGFNDSFSMPGAEQQYDLAGKVGQFYKDRYGDWDAIKNTMATDPVGFLGDASMLASGGGAAAVRLPIAGAQATGRVLSTAGRLMDPVRMAGKGAKLTGQGAGYVATYPLSLTSGTAPEAIQAAAKTGYAGGEAGDAFRKSMRGHEAPETVVREAHQAMGNMAENRRRQYLQDMQETTASQAQVDTAPIRQTLEDLRKSLQVDLPPTPPIANQPASNVAAFAPLEKGTPQEFAKLKEMEKLLETWEAHPQGTTPLGLDALKQRLGRLQPSFTDPNAANERRLVTAAGNAVKDAITAKVPSYGEAMGNYEKAMDLKTDLEKSLTGGPNTSTDTIINKLRSTLTNERRAGLAKTLEEHGAPHLTNRVAGQNLRSVMPKGGLGKIVAALTGTGAYFNPTLAPALLAASPRALGEIAHALGRGTRFAERHGNTQAAILAALLGRNQQEQPQW